MGKNYKETLNELLKNPEFKAEYEALEPEFQIIRAMLEGREKLNLTQKDLAERSGITQADISRLENGNANPSIRTLKKLAYLISHRGQICSREQILSRVWSDEVVVLDRTIDVNITRLRSKIGPYGSYIVTRSGFGYGFRD